MNPTVSEVRAELAEVVNNGVCEDSPEVITAINRATRELMRKGNWVGTIVKTFLCARQCCVTLPWELYSARAVNACNVPVDLRTVYYEALRGEGVHGYYRDQYRPIDAHDGLEVPAWFDVCGQKYLKVYTEYNEDSDTVIRFKGMQYVQDDGSGNPVTKPLSTLPGPVDYEELPIVTGEQTVNLFTQVTHIQKSLTKGLVRIHTVDPDTGDEFVLAIMHPNQTRGQYRRYKIPSIPDDGTTVTVEVIAKRRFIEVRNDTDELIIGNVDALREQIRSMNWRASDPQKSAISAAQAKNFLEEELRDFLGPVKRQVRMDMKGYAPGQVRNIV